ncbi:MAG: DUF6600 domain-containing protein [Thermoanaerobaculales bacterium]
MRTAPIIVAMPAAALLLTLGCVVAPYEPPPPPPPEAAYEPAPPPPDQGGEVSLGVFYDSLAPYGSWVTISSYGQVWVPRVEPYWRPYTTGHWAYTDDGWLWVADETWGWAPFHYGRWFFDVEYGWAWVPGTVWAPAWVAWRYGGGHIGWAPIPPQVRWEAGFGFRAGAVDFDAVIAPQHWCFVDERYVTAPVLREYFVPPARNVTIINVTTNVTNYTVINNRIVNRGVDVQHVEQVTRQSVPRYHLAEANAPSAAHVVDTGQLAVYRPNLTSPRGTPPSVKPVTGGAPTNTPVPPRPVTIEERQKTSSGARVIGTGNVAPITQTTAITTTQEIAQRHALELQQLQAHQAEERDRLAKIHTNEKAQVVNPSVADQLKLKHAAELQALEQQHANEAKLLALRHERELAAAKAKGNPPKSPNDTKEKDHKPWTETRVAAP